MNLNRNIIVLIATLPWLMFTPVWTAAGEAPSIEQGKKLYFLEQVNSKGVIMSCTTCHTSNPKEKGKTKANKIIEPMAPVVNAERFTDVAKTEKWFKRNCNDVLDRECTQTEKDSFILYMKSIK